MRIGETVVVQLVESEPPNLVIVDDESGAEIILDTVMFGRLKVAVAYFDAAMTQPSMLTGDPRVGIPQ